MDNVQILIPAVAVVDQETVEKTVTMSDGTRHTGMVATGRIVVLADRLAAAAADAVAGFIPDGWQIAGDPQVVDDDPAAVAMLTVTVPIGPAN